LTLYSIGHSSLAAGVFLSHLQRFSISLLVDVRRYPVSRRHPQFSRGPLESLLSGASIDYLHLGEQLGGFRDGAYEAYMRTEPFRRGIATLRENAHREPAFLCAEKNPWECHRRFIAEELSRLGLEVRHIVDGQLMLFPD
jgi:uncharacterized protein (DUF488 family)